DPSCRRWTKQRLVRPFAEVRERGPGDRFAMPDMPGPFLSRTGSDAPPVAAFLLDYALRRLAVVAEFLNFWRSPPPAGRQRRQSWREWPRQPAKYSRQDPARGQAQFLLRRQKRICFVERVFEIGKRCSADERRPARGPGIV